MDMTKHVELLKKFLSPDMEIEDKIAMMTDNPTSEGMKLTKPEFIARAELTLTSAYVMIQENEKTEHFERCDLLKRFVKELKRVYLLAVRTYSDYTLADFFRLEKANERIMTRFYPEAACV